MEIILERKGVLFQGQLFSPLDVEITTRDRFEGRVIEEFSIGAIQSKREFSRRDSIDRVKLISYSKDRHSEVRGISFESLHALRNNLRNFLPRTYSVWRKAFDEKNVLPVQLHRHREQTSSRWLDRSVGFFRVFSGLVGSKVLQVAPRSAREIVPTVDGSSGVCELSIGRSDG